VCPCKDCEVVLSAGARSKVRLAHLARSHHFVDVPLATVVELELGACRWCEQPKRATRHRGSSSLQQHEVQCAKHPGRRFVRTGESAAAGAAAAGGSARCGGAAAAAALSKTAAAAPGGAAAGGGEHGWTWTASAAATERASGGAAGAHSCAAARCAGASGGQGGGVEEARCLFHSNHAEWMWRRNAFLCRVAPNDASWRPLVALGARTASHIAISLFAA